jgi:hypothetical protein
MAVRSKKAHEIADEVVAAHDADLRYPKLLHKSMNQRFEQYFLRYSDEAVSRQGASLVDTYAAAELLLEKYGPSYHIPNLRKHHTFS